MLMSREPGNDRGTLAQWRRAMAREASLRETTALAEITWMQRLDALSTGRVPTPIGGMHAVEVDPQRVTMQGVVAGATRRLVLISTRDELSDDDSEFAGAVRLLRRHARALRQRFDVGWASAAAVLFGEAIRRNVSTKTLARALVRDLGRKDAYGPAT